MQAQNSSVSNTVPNDVQLNKDTSSSATNVESSHTIDLTQEQSAAVNLSDDTPIVQAKGKRRSTFALRSAKGCDSPGETSASTLRSDGRLLKTIKQEKP